MFAVHELSIDHVHPRCKGGRLCWYVPFCVCVYLFIYLFIFIHVVHPNNLPASGFLTPFYASSRENAVTCCKSCNGRKGFLLPSELNQVGMKLVRDPKCPTHYD